MRMQRTYSIKALKLRLIPTLESGGVVEIELLYLVVSSILPSIPAEEVSKYLEANSGSNTVIGKVVL